MARYVKTQWNTTTVFNPTNMNHIEQGIYDADLRDGGTIGGSLNIINKGTSSTVGNSTLILGNNIAEGSADNSRGRIGIFSNNTRYTWFYASDDQTANRTIYLPDKNGTIALTSDIPYYVDVTVTTDSNGYANLSSNAPVSKTISAEVMSPRRQSCDLWINEVEDANYRVYVYSRGSGAPATASTECVVRVWRLP